MSFRQSARLQAKTVIAVKRAAEQVSEQSVTKRARRKSPTPSPTLERKPSPFSAPASPVTEVEEPEPPASPKKRRTRVKEPIVYVIPEVERKTTTFNGRLGYACLNTILRNRKPAADSVFCSRTCRIDSIKKNGMEFVKDLGQKNISDLITMIQWNEDHKIRFMRMSSEMFPFASHPLYGYSLEYCASTLAEAGALAKKYGHRLTTHPGQYTQLGSPKEAVVKAAIKELEYHTEMCDRMGLGPDSVMIIHGGGVYGDKVVTLERLKNNIRTLVPEHVRRRIVLENDELCYSAEDLLPVCEELDIPLVFDYHHDSINPSSIPPRTIIDRANAIFRKRGIKPKQHLSEPRPGAVTIMERRAHADRCQSLPADLPDDMDLMIEAKDKEQAVFELYRIYGLEEVKHESLRPPSEHQSKETKGRKSNKKGRKKAAGEEDDDSEGDAAVLDSVEEAQKELTTKDAKSSKGKKPRRPRTQNEQTDGGAVEAVLDVAKDMQESLHPIAEDVSHAAKTKSRKSKKKQRKPADVAVGGQAKE